MKIIGTGRFLPEAVLTNDDLSTLVDTNDDWITTRTGISQRHIASDENTTDLATKAAKRAISNAGIEANEIDLIVVATSTPDSFIPGVSHTVLKNLKIEHAMAFDVNAACTGFIYGLDITSSLMKAHDFKYALLIGAEVMSKLVNWQDRNTCVLFGDGAGAVIIKQCANANPIYAKSTTIPDESHALASGGLALKHPFHLMAQSDMSITMKGQDVFKFAVSRVCESIAEALAETGISSGAVDYYVLHQANSRILDYVAKKLNVASEKFYSTIAHTGNTSAASIPIVLDEMNEKGHLKAGMTLVLTGFGAGLTYGSVVLTW